MGFTRGSQLCVRTLSPSLAFGSPKPPSPLARFFRVLRQAAKPNEISGVDGPIVRQYLDGLEVAPLLTEVKFPSQFEDPMLLSQWIYLFDGSLSVLLLTGIERALATVRE